MRLLATAALGLALGAACGEKGQGSEQAEPEEPDSEVAPPGGAEGPAAQEPGEEDVADGPGSTGVAECDELIGRMIACTKMPAEVRAAYRRTAETWRDTVEEGGDRVREAIRDGCLRARPSWAETLARAGC
jgi:hypothetical protein